jgi:hypothetical protein
MVARGFEPDQTGHVSPARRDAAHESVVRVRRFAENPIIRPAMLPGRDGDNINGPSLIRVPDWVRKPLGRYYLL